MINKERLIESLKAMPEEQFDDIDMLLERIVILEKIESGIKDMEEGNTLSHEDMKKEIDSWYTK